MGFFQFKHIFNWIQGSKSSCQRQHQTSYKYSSYQRCTAVHPGPQTTGNTHWFIDTTIPNNLFPILETPKVTLEGGIMSFDAPLPPYNASDPHASFLNSTCLDLLLIEIVPLAHRLANELSVTNEPLDDEEEREAMFYRLETLGYRVGQGLVERFSRDRTRMVDTLDVIKFICKDLWTIVFRKQIDNLKTNHRGVYVLTDNTFRPFARMSSEAGGNAVARAQPFLWFPCGIVRGALANMGVNASVQAETTELPAATFKIETISKVVV